MKKRELKAEIEQLRQEVADLRAEVRRMTQPIGYPVIPAVPNLDWPPLKVWCDVGSTTTPLPVSRHTTC